MQSEYKDFLKKLNGLGFLSTKHILKNPFRTKDKFEEYQKIKKELLELTSFAKNLTPNQRMRLVRHNISETNYYCPVCDKPRQYNVKKSRWFLTCNSKDSKHNEYLKTLVFEKSHKTIQETYGVNSPAQIPGVNEKIKRTCLERYGVDNQFKRPDFQKKREKYFQENFGVKHQMELSSVVERIKTTSLKKYGVSNYMKTEECQNKRKDLSIQKYGTSFPKQAHYAIKPQMFSKENLQALFIKNNHLDLNRAQMELNCCSTTVYKLIKQYDIKYNKLAKTSRPEEEIINFIKELDPNTEIVKNTRDVIKPLELDIYLPEYNLAIEYNGLMFHSQGISNYSMFNTPDKDRNMHLKKTEACEAKGIQLLHIFENEFLDEKTKAIWQSVVRNKMHKNKYKIGARNCSLRALTSVPDEQKLVKKFLEENHLQGSDAIGPIRYGLFYDSNLVALMTFSKARFSKADYELIRFAIKGNYSIPGAASKLLKAFKKDHDGTIVSYANRRWSDGNLYKKLGFELNNKSNPNYFYFYPNKNQLWHRANFQKHKLNDKLDIFDNELNEAENMFMNGYRRIFDSGNYVFIFRQENNSS